MATKSGRKRKHDQTGRTTKKADQVNVPYLSRDIVQNILARLPAKSILRSKRVCTEWRDIIQDPDFAQSHYHKSHIALVGLRRKRSSQKKILMLEHYHGPEGLKLEPLRATFHFTSDHMVVNSCRGFLLLKNSILGLLIYNPLTTESFSLSLSHQFKYIITDYDLCGLGFSPTTQHYKVVTLLRRLGKMLVTTLGNCEWRTIDGPVSIFKKIPAQYNNPVAVNANIHWLATGEHIAGFDLDQEELSLIASPRLGKPSKHIISIGVVHGCLCMNITDIGNSRHGVESWVMKEYGKAESWTLLCVVKSFELNVGLRLRNYKVMESGEKGKILVLTPKGILLTYDLERHECLNRQLQVQGFNLMQGMQLHCLGFFSLTQPPNQLAG